MAGKGGWLRVAAGNEIAQISIGDAEQTLRKMRSPRVQAVGRRCDGLRSVFGSRRVKRGARG